MRPTRQLAEKAASLLIILGMLMGVTNSALTAFAENQAEVPTQEIQARAVTAVETAVQMDAVAAAVAMPTASMLAEGTVVEGAAQNSIQQVIVPANEDFIATGVLQDLAAKKAAEEAARKAAEEAARKKAAEEAARKKAAEEAAVAAGNVDADDLLWLARIIHVEAGNQPFEGRVAVANVVLHRVQSSRFPNTVYAVLHQKNQFTSVNRAGFSTLKPCQTCLDAAAAALNGTDVVPGCKWFISKQVSSSWATKNATYYVSIGNHKFYK